MIGAHTGHAAMAVYLDGTEEQTQNCLVPSAQGAAVGAFGLTEAQAGSDAAAIKTTAVRDGDDFVINGAKIFITNGDICEFITTMAVTDPAMGAYGGITAFIVETDTPGFSIGSLENKMGIRGSSTAECVFEDVRVPKENVLGQFGAGFLTFMKTLDIGRASLGAATLGGAQAAMEASIQWAKAREQFGVPIATKQSVHFMIADMAVEIEALRSLIYRTAWMIDSGQPHILEAAACGIPAVTTDVGSCRELLEGKSEEDRALGPGGILCRFHSPEDTAVATLELLTNDETYEAMSKSGRKRMEKYYDKRDMISTYKNVYEEYI